MKKFLILLLLHGLFATVSAQHLVVYRITGQYIQVGDAFADNSNLAGAREETIYNGVFLHDPDSGRVCVVWRARIEGRKTQETRDFGTTFSNYRALGRASNHNVFAHNSVEDQDTDTFNDLFRTVFVAGGQARKKNIGSGLQVTLARIKTGYEWVVDEILSSYTVGKITLRYDRRFTQFSNITLADRDGDLDVDIDDMKLYWQAKYRAARWFP